MQNSETFSILLVDDDPIVIRVLNHILSAYSPVRFATSGRTALKLARESVPDLVILDVDMPELSGFEVCKQFKDDPALADVPIVFMTGHDSPQMHAKGIELGAADFINKPPHAPLVLAQVRTCQRLKSLSDSLTGALPDAVTMDFPTGALTRPKLESSLAQEWLRTQRTAAPLAFLIADIVGCCSYKANDDEARGDACLKAVADALRSAAQRSIDRLGRWSGGQFALLLPETDGPGANVVAKRAIDAVHSMQIHHASSAVRDLNVTMFIGGTYLAGSRAGPRSQTASVSPHELVAAAENALHAARSAHGERLAVIEFTASEASHASLRTGRRWLP